jgi:pyrroline-5-carboxylate reductase
MKMESLGFIGGGRITKIFLQALINRQQRFDKVMVFDNNPEILKALKQHFPWIETAETVQEAAKQELLFIALHPPMIMETLEKIADTVTQGTCVISFAPKITIEKIASKLKTINIARMIPNATSYINEGYNPISFHDAFDQAEKKALTNFLSLLGNTFEVREDKLEAYAVLSAMLPTYFWFQWDELRILGSKMGLTEEESKNSIEQTLKAAIDLMFCSKLTSEEVRDLIPVKPILEHEEQIKEIYRTKLPGLFEKIKP